MKRNYKMIVITKHYVFIHHFRSRKQAVEKFIEYTNYLEEHSIGFRNMVILTAYEKIQKIWM